jgi:hypothetical protein
MRSASYRLSIASPDGYRCAQVIRIVRLMRLLERRQFLPTLNALARELEVCTRTVRRDLEVLRLVGARVPPVDPETRRPIDRSLPPPLFALEPDEPNWFEVAAFSSVGGAQ